MLHSDFILPREDVQDRFRVVLHLRPVHRVEGIGVVVAASRVDYTVRAGMGGYNTRGASPVSGCLACLFDRWFRYLPKSRVRTRTDDTDNPTY